MTVNLPSEEMAFLNEIAERYDMSKTAIIRKALRIYRMIDERQRRGDKVFVEPEIGPKAEMLI